MWADQHEAERSHSYSAKRAWDGWDEPAATLDKFERDQGLGQAAPAASNAVMGKLLQFLKATRVAQINTVCPGWVSSLALFLPEFPVRSAASVQPWFRFSGEQGHDHIGHRTHE